MKKVRFDRPCLSKLATGAIGFAALFVLSAGVSDAQCRLGSGPDMGDGIPYCAEQVPPARPSQPRQSSSLAAAVAWGYGPEGEVFIGVEHYLDEGLARDVAMRKCVAKGWRSCEIADSITNGMIAIGITPKGQLASGVAATPGEAKASLRRNCAKAGTSCKILKIFDGRAEP